MEATSKTTYFAWTLMCAVCMAVMLIFASRKTIVITDTTQLHVDSGTETSITTKEIPLELRKVFGVEGSFSIPLPKGIRAENVILENRYLSKEICLCIDGEFKEFYENSEISGDISSVMGATVQIKDERTHIYLRMNRIYEYQSTLDNNLMTVVWYEPQDLYQKIVVIDPVLYPGATLGEGILENETGIRGNEDTNQGIEDVTLEIAKRVLENFSNNDVKIYLTRFDQDEIALENTLAVLREMNADYYIRIALNSEGNQEDYGIKGIYNEEYYIPDFGNLELADLLTKEVTLAASNRAIGLEQASEDSILKLVSIPASEIVVGNLQHPKERYLLHQGDYCDKLAEGIILALQETVKED